MRIGGRWIFAVDAGLHSLLMGEFGLDATHV